MEKGICIWKKRKREWNGWKKYPNSRQKALPHCRERTCRISCLDRRRWRSRNQTGRKKSMGNPFLILPDGRTGIKKRGNISMARWRQNRMRRQPMRSCWKRQSREMRMPCTTWERFMHRALDVRQTKKRQMCGTKKHWRQCIM